MSYYGPRKALDMAPEAVERRAKNKARRDLKFRRQSRNKMKYILTDHLDLRDAFVFMRGKGNGLVDDIRSKFIKWGDLSDKQIDLICRIADKARNPEPQPATVSAPSTGKNEFLTVTGKIVSTKDVFGNYGYQTKMLVVVQEDQGIYKIWSTVPSNILDQFNSETLKGKTITFTASFSVSYRDPSFCFANRPKKASIIENAEVK